MYRKTLMTMAVIVAVGVVSCAPSPMETQTTPTTATTAPSAAAPAAPQTAEQKAAEYRKSAEKRAKEALDVLALNDPAKEEVVRNMIVEYVPTLMAWQDAHEAELKGLWDQWRKARSEEKDEVKAEQIISQIDAVYATFKPQHEAFWTKLGSLVTAEQVGKVKDRYTARKLPVTYNAYLAIFPILTEKQKAFTHAQLALAREEALDARTMDEKSDFFKKYKLRIEAQFEREGIDTRKYRREFSAKQKAEAAARKAATQPATHPATQPATQPAQ